MAAPAFIIPSETRVREFDAKLLLAGVLAERGHRSIVGSRIEMHNEVLSLPRGVYVAKDFWSPSEQMFRILRGLGHDIVAWDEEGVVTGSAEMYHRKRVHGPTIEHTSMLFAWGEENADRIRTAPDYHGVPLIVAGNPRADMTRREVRPYFDPEVAELREQYGDIVLVNTNFGRLNHHLPHGTFVPGEPSQLRVKPDGFETSIWQRRMEIFKFFQDLVPELARRLPEASIVVRPHPAEEPEFWREVCSAHPNAYVRGDGNVQAWLLASRAMIHNGCTTGLEAFLLERPALAYLPTEPSPYDLNLTNDLSLSVRTLDALVEQLNRFLAGAPAPEPTPEQRGLAASTVAALDGPLACDRIADALETHVTRPGAEHRASWRSVVQSSVTARVRRAWKRRHARQPGHKNSEAANQHRFPDLSVAEVENRLGRFQRALGRFEGVRVASMRRNIFEVLPPA